MCKSASNGCFCGNDPIGKLKNPFGLGLKIVKFTG